MGVAFRGSQSHLVDRTEEKEKKKDIVVTRCFHCFTFFVFAEYLWRRQRRQKEPRFKDILVCCAEDVFFIQRDPCAAPCDR